MAAMAVVANAGHVIELADGTHHGTRVVLVHRLSSSSHQRLDLPAQQLFAIDAGFIHFILDLHQGSLKQADDPRLGRSYVRRTAGIDTTAQPITQ